MVNEIINNLNILIFSNFFQDPIEILKNTAANGNSTFYLKSTVSFSLNESLGVIKIENSQQDSVREKSEAKGQIFRVILAILFVIFVIVGWYFYSLYQKNSVHEQNIEWLTEFYAKNAPQVIFLNIYLLSSLICVYIQKLSEINFIENTLQKHEGNMFLLWRQLMKTYKVKWDPPASILDTVNDDDYKSDF